jgi:hypothetical protein
VAAQFRANYTKLALKLARRLPAPSGAAVVAAVGEATIKEIVGAGVLQWLPAEKHQRVVAAVFETLGAEGTRNFWCNLMLQSFQRSLLKPLVEGGLRLFGRTPRAILKLTPQAYSLIARDCGVIQVEDAEGAVRLRFDELPALLRTPAFVELCHGNCLAVLGFLDQRGSITPDLTRLSRGSFSLAVAAAR